MIQAIWKVFTEKINLVLERHLARSIQNSKVINSLNFGTKG